ncbi:MAG TPA: ABC transporter permease [Candidatus Methylomirabilis sp.]|nr:ABC transporter permease [Candidatus Methylomirabilis sp.]HSB80119.1 ABC transporter permease [Candidatus Methylomirabilis sp.]
MRKPLESSLKWLRTFARRYPLSTIWGLVAVLIILLGIFAPLVSPDDPLRPNVLARAQGPSWQHWLGTDFIGRDVLSRIVHGTTWSLFVAVTSVLLGTTLGAVWAVASAFFGGTFDLLGERLVEVLLSFPPILLALLLASALGASTWTVILSIAATRVAYGTRIIRSQALAVREIPYVEAARSLGSSSWRIIFFHIAPQCIGTYLVLVTTSLGIAIVLEATLGFLGAGIPPPTPTWGNMLGDAASMLIPKWHLVVFPGVSIVITVLAFNQLGDGLRDAFDPRLRGTNI